MDTVVSQLLEVDKEARRTLDEAQQYYDKTMQEIAAEKEELLATYKHKCQTRLDEVRETEQQNFEDAAQQIQQDYNKKIRQLEQRYTENHAVWEDALFQKCIGR